LDKITTTGTGRDLQYVFTYHEPGKGEQISAYIVTVYSPDRHNSTWCAVKFYIADVVAYQVVSERELTPREITFSKP
jgi:hypothetical protein